MQRDDVIVAEHKTCVDILLEITLVFLLGMTLPVERLVWASADRPPAKDVIVSGNRSCELLENQ